MEKPLTPLKPNDVVACFGCGVHNPHGLKMTFATDGDGVISEVTVPKHLGGWNNLVHGGVLSTICDEIMGWTAMYRLGKMALTKTMTVNFRKAVFISDTLRAEGRVVEVIDTTEAIVEGSVRNGKGELCVTARGVFALLDAKTGIRMGILDEVDAHRFFEAVFEPDAAPETRKSS
jgi:uncharacterized protein (TIGR00369 family)